MEEISKKLFINQFRCLSYRKIHPADHEKGVSSNCFVLSKKVLIWIFELLHSLNRSNIVLNYFWKYWVSIIFFCTNVNKTISRNVTTGSNVIVGLELAK